MAYNISGTTQADKDLLDQIRDLAWRERKDVSEVIREAFRLRLSTQEEEP